MINWINFFQKSLNNNIQLQFYDLSTISFINDNICESDILKLNKIDIKNNLLFYEFNLKENYSNSLIKNNKISLIHYFPLTKEKYRIKGNIYFYNKNGFIKNKIDDLDIDLDFKEIWNKLDNEKKKEYKENIPNLKKEKIDKKEYDLQNFNNPFVNSIPENFSIIIIDCFNIEILFDKLPQVIADKRIKFESEFKKYKVRRKFIFNKINNDNWEINEVNS